MQFFELKENENQYVFWNFTWFYYSSALAGNTFVQQRGHFYPWPTFLWIRNPPFFPSFPLLIFSFNLLINLAHMRSVLYILYFIGADFIFFFFSNSEILWHLFPYKSNYLINHMIENSNKEIIMFIYIRFTLQYLTLMNAICSHAVNLRVAYISVNEKRKCLILKFRSLTKYVFHLQEVWTPSTLWTVTMTMPPTCDT